MRRPRAARHQPEDAGWQRSYFLAHLIEGDGSWGGTRLMMLFATIMSCALFGRLMEWQLSARDWVVPIIGDNLFTEIVAFPLSFFKFEALRHWLTPVAAVVLAVVTGVLYLQDIFEFKNFDEARRYFFASLFGSGYPYLVINEGHEEAMPSGEGSVIDAIGGPGYVVIKHGNAVLLERGVGPTRVLSAGHHFLRRFETIRAILDLREIYREIKEVKAMTRDGILLIVRDVEATFRLDTGRYRRTNLNPYPFSVRAVRQAVYGGLVNKDGQIADWGDVVARLIAGEIGEWAERQRLDRLTAPALLEPTATAPDPRALIRAHFDSTNVRRKLVLLGAELIWINIGHFDTPELIDGPRLEQWRSFWQGQDKVTLAYGEAQRVRLEEIGRAEGQARMLRAIADTLQTLLPGAQLDDRLAELVLLRLSQVLDAMTAPPGLSELRQSPTLQGFPPERPAPLVEEQSGGG